MHKCIGCWYQVSHNQQSHLKRLSYSNVALKKLAVLPSLQPHFHFTDCAPKMPLLWWWLTRRGRCQYAAAWPRVPSRWRRASRSGQSLLEVPSHSPSTLEHTGRTCTQQTQHWNKLSAPSSILLLAFPWHLLISEKWICVHFLVTSYSSSSEDYGKTKSPCFFIKSLLGFSVMWTQLHLHLLAAGIEPSSLAAGPLVTTWTPWIPSWSGSCPGPPCIPAQESLWTSLVKLISREPQPYQQAHTALHQRTATSVKREVQENDYW